VEKKYLPWVFFRSLFSRAASSAISTPALAAEGRFFVRFTAHSPFFRNLFSRAAKGA
jgi:hypothetical protein